MQNHINSSKNKNTRGRRQRVWALAAVLSAALAAVAAVQPKLTLTSGGSQFQLQLHGLKANQIYQIKASPNLRDWTTIGQRASDSNGSVTVTDPQSGVYSRRYYKAVAATSPAGLGLNAYSAAKDKILVKPKAGLSLGGLNLTLGVSVLNVFPAIGNLQVV